MKETIFAISLLAGTIIGTGIFALPYLTVKVGILIILGYFIILGIAVTLIHYFFSEVAFETPDFLRLPGFAKHHLGKKGYYVSLISAIFGLIGTTLSYLILGGKFLTILFSSFLGLSESFYTFTYFVIGATLIYFGVKAITKVQFWGLIFLLGSLLIATLVSIPYLKLSNIPLFEANMSNLFLPYGAVFFSLWGLTLIPETEEVLGKKKKLLKKVIPISIIIPIILYLVFILLVVGAMGMQTPEDALNGLQHYLGNEVFLLILVFAIVATFTSFITTGLTLKRIFSYDLKINEKLSWMIATFVPIILFFIGFNDFLKTISLVGGVVLGVDGILALLMYKKIKPQRKLIVYPLILFLLGGIIYSIFYFL